MIHEVEYAEDLFSPAKLIERTIRVVLVGAGGTGSEMADVLARLHHGLLGVGHPGGLAVTIADGDTVSPSNIGRQRFGSMDVGVNKAIVLAHRYNLFYQLDWKAHPFFLSEENSFFCTHDFDLMITCVDNAKTRIAIAEHYSDSEDADDVLWFDFGNGQYLGQCCLGHLGSGSPSDVSIRLPNVVDLYPELDKVDDTQEPTCSLAEALRHQDLFVNRALATAGGAILWNLLRHGQITAHGAFVDIRKGTTTPLNIDENTWRFMGYDSSHFPVAA